MIVARPACAVLAVEVGLLIHRLFESKQITHEESQMAHQGMLLMQPYKMIGFTEDGQRVKDKDGQFLELVQIGDSFLDDPTDSHPVRGLPSDSQPEG